MSLQGKTLFITGASRGIGLAIALRAARDGANIVIAAKSDVPHKHLSGTIHTAAAEIEAAGGKALALKVDIRDQVAVEEAVAQAVNTFSGIDICINNASAISMTGTLNTDMRRFDLMHSVNTRGTFLVSRACLPHLMKASNPHVLNLSPPLDMSANWFGPHVAYTMAKFGMSMCVLGMAEEFRSKGIAFNALWPRTAIATAAMEFAITGPEGLKSCRKVDILSDAAYIILTRSAGDCTGNFFIDDVLLFDAGERNFDQYRMDPTQHLLPDFFVPADTPVPPGVSMLPVA